ncbi:hypothetical protein [Paraburkholderia sp. CNPSo 3281]|uniref:hypothetical protein n=1 Tax=Paraburkholderia sp. CNPSo 3281 TaxID=2940933 RepID=UPI0020B8BDE5|nr:hypothetical protein [Paraburkholderia sp. CNPSo 3281]MCP3715072.1 hypothetical protein [Paraburkholderia sp. CNPSo 3281]
MSAKFGLGLAGQTLVDTALFHDGDVNLAPHSVVVLKVKTNQVDKFSAGTYDLYAGAFMRMEAIGIRSSPLYVDFHSDYKNPTRITFDRDYPSTPQEREQWEAMHKAEMSWQPVKPGQTFSEDGLYRAVRTDNGHRGLLLVATTGRVTMDAGAARCHLSPTRRPKTLMRQGVGAVGRELSPALPTKSLGNSNASRKPAQT